MPENILFFTHIERSAGTATHQYLAEVLRGYYVVSPSSKLFSNEPESATDPRQVELMLRTPMIRGIGGHSLRPWSIPGSQRHRILPVTFIRHPIDRFLSHVALLNTHTRRSWTVLECATDRRLGNWQCVKLAGVADAELAEAQLRNYVVAGRVEELSITLPELAGSLSGVRRPFDEIANRGTGLVRWADLSDEERHCVTAANREDLKLWDRFTPRFELQAGDWCGRGRSMGQRLWSLTVEMPTERIMRASIDEATVALAKQRSSELWTSH